jgi:hypothetical protein
VISTAPSAMDGCVTISDFTPNLCVKSITASGPTLSISFADTVLIEFAKLFLALPFRDTCYQSF